MAETKPEYFRPALIAGAVAGFLSGLPVIGGANCLCCLWIVGGAAAAVKLLGSQTPGLLRAADGAVTGALTGVVAAVVETVVKVPFRRFNLEMARRVLDWMSDVAGDAGSGFEGWLDSSSGFLSPGWTVLALLFTAAVYAVMGSLGGIVGISLFAKKAAPPAAPPPPPAAPRADLQGPTDAA